MMRIFLLSFFLLAFAGCQTQEQTEGTSPQGRGEYELLRLQDPETGEIPPGIRMRELAFASTLPKASLSRSRQSLQQFTPIGPYNVGGRTRMVEYDMNNPSVIITGGVSGGMWRSADEGQSWVRTTTGSQHAAVSCIAQDKRPGKGNVWFYGSGEYRSNSASKSGSATYLGSGIYTSQDSGKTWTHLPSTATEPQRSNVWSYVHRLAVDPSRMDSTIVVAATHRGIYYSNNAGQSWKEVLGTGINTSIWSDVVVSSTGVFYAAMQSTAGNQKGFHRSEDGLNWTNITSGSFPGVHERSVLALAPSNENILYTLSETPGNGKPDTPNNPSEFTSLWKYTYLSGNGAGTNGSWVDRSIGLPSDVFRNSYTSFSGYCTGIAVKPDNPDVVFIGGSNMFRSTNGFLTPSQTAQIGGYTAQGYPSFDWQRDNHHPDLHHITFHPNNPDYLLCSTDGGLHFTTDCEAFKVEWESYNNGFITTQFYAVSVDKYSENEVVTGGLQDNGSVYTNRLSATEDWKYLRGGDGTYTAVTDNGRVHFVSTQRANIDRTTTNNSGDVLSRTNIMPDNTSGYLFVHPFAIDPADENAMYLPNINSIYTNTDLAAVENGVKAWTLTASMSATSNITAIGASKTPRGTVYAGMQNRRIYKMENAHLGATAALDVTSNITSGTYTSCIAVDERDANHAVAIYSNYNVISAWATYDGGQTWIDIEGNLKGTAAPGTPPQFAHISDGPSFRWLEIIPISDSTQVYMLGTSIGLFATNTLAGKSTVWIQQADDVIGNVVVDMIDFRASDGFTAIGTHGNGVFTTYMENEYDITSDELVSAQEAIDLKVYPNPVINQANVSFMLEQAQAVKIEVFDLNGRSVQGPVKRHYNSGIVNERINLNEIPGGLYFVKLKGETFHLTKSITVR